MKKLIKRLKSKTPDFFKRVQIIGGSLSALCTGIIAVPNITERLATLATHGIVVGAIMILISQFAVDSSASIK